ncbi:fibronectin type III domain-containing protein [Amycolatopsis sp. NPDC059027]|uniref:fibronectin type III domain-containing protein n=1 Tax=Amycolatopsis sp. NPDC059027 TaxID=3346709 RepID=UPI00366D7AEE
MDRSRGVTVNATEPKAAARRGFSAVVRTRLAIALLVTACLVLIGVAVSGRAPMPAGLQFVQVGHWVYSSELQSALHIDGGTSQVDARASVPGAEQGSQVAQGERSGYVVERSRITMFDKSTLSVENAATPPATETPAVLEAVGGPYLVYRNAGQIVRLGDPTATVPAGGPLSPPVVTSAGTLWVHRIDNGSVCELPRGATRLACPAQLPPGHGGLLALVDDQPVLLDITADTLSVIGKDGLGEPVGIGVKLPPSAQVANTSVDGRLAVADPERNQLHLIDTAGLAGKRPASKPVSVELPKDGRFAGPVATTHVVAMVDETRNEVRTYDSTGSLKSTKKVPGKGDRARLAHGEDNRIYVDSADGSHVLVVNGDNGSVVEVAVDEQARNQTTSAAPPASQPADNPQPPAQPPASPPPSRQSAPPVAAATPPGAPRNVSASAGNGAATVSWGAAPENGARITAYHLSWPGGSTTVGGSARSATVNGLTAGTSYTITVVAENSAGRGAGAGARVLIQGPPAGAPSVTVNAKLGGQVSASWSQPDLHGATLLHYVVSATGQGDRQVSGTSADFSGMSGAVTVTVRAVTQYGSGPALTGSAGSKTATVPTEPPTIKITRVRTMSNLDLVVTVSADGKGSPATCQATVFGKASSSSVACSGSTQLTIPNVQWFGGATVKATITTAAGTREDNWQGTPEVGGGGGAPGSSGGFLFWIGPVALVGLRHGKGKTKVEKEKGLL